MYQSGATTATEQSPFVVDPQPRQQRCCLSIDCRSTRGEDPLRRGQPRGLTRDADDPYRHVVGATQHLDRDDAVVVEPGRHGSRGRAVLCRLSDPDRSRSSDARCGAGRAVERLADSRGGLCHRRSGAHRLSKAYVPAHGCRGAAGLDDIVPARFSDPSASRGRRVVRTEMDWLGRRGSRISSTGGALRSCLPDPRHSPAGGSGGRRAERSSSDVTGAVPGPGACLGSGDVELGARPAPRRTVSGGHIGTMRSSPRPGSKRRQLRRRPQRPIRPASSRRAVRISRPWPGTGCFRSAPQAVTSRRASQRRFPLRRSPAGRARRPERSP